MANNAALSKRDNTIGEMADLSGLSVHTLRWYEAQGLFPRDIRRTPGGQRIFDTDAALWLMLLTRLRESGMPVADMAKYSDLVRAGDGNESERIELMEAHASSLDTKIEELIAYRQVIRDKIVFYRQALVEKPL
ncbi:MerR family transcriptional regulator [Arthrobacter cryoconiti]|uniref:MerR family transcriptional regulator n=1 Tax=Arthrobacter cryoconiti TaxID=748907 RepID=A0ABV8R1F6_9MICC|nr:MerR family transcriptional regulator [Arthrobacter cryoconiti]MCC9068180.1 MerR family transcriptional regulator [Arthrobacter cryoconiti]